MKEPLETPAVALPGEPVAQILGKIYRDLSRGRATLRVLSSAPELSDLERGQMVLRSDVPRLYVRIGDSLYYIGLTGG